jgi:pimeloyl-ACP methyl ester carboxylesterase
MTDPRLIFISVGGWGDSQLDDIEVAVMEIPGVAIRHPFGMDQFRDSHELIWAYMRSYPKVPIVLCGHSLGAATARNSANLAILDGGFEIAGLVLLDPVQWFDAEHSCRCKNTLVFQAWDSFPFIPSPVDGFPAFRVLNTNHNSLAHDSWVIQQIVDFVQKILAGGAT